MLYIAILARKCTPLTFRAKYVWFGSSWLLTLVVIVCYLLTIIMVLVRCRCVSFTRLVGCVRCNRYLAWNYAAWRPGLAWSMNDLSPKMYLATKRRNSVGTAAVQRFAPWKSLSEYSKRRYERYKMLRHQIYVFYQSVQDYIDSAILLDDTLRLFARVIKKLTLCWLNRRQNISEA